MNNTSIKVSSSKENINALCTLIKPNIGDINESVFRVLESKDEQRGLDSALLIAVVGGIGTTIGALITGILKVMENRVSHKITITGKSGRKIEFPSSLPKEDIDNLIEKTKELDIDRIEF